jgi:hypothetical protein
MNTTKGSPYGTYRINAVIVGVLFIIATVAGTIAASIGNPIVDAPDYLTKISANENTIITDAFLVFLMAISCAGIGLGLYPIMRKYSVGMAIGAVGFRVIESMIDMLGGVSTIALLALSQEFVKAGAPDALYFQTIGAVIKAGDEWLSNGVMLLSWCIGALMYYSVFYQYRLVPRWLSGWGLVGITLTTISSVLVMFHIIPGFGTIQMVANLPIALQEMVFAIWLIAKGVNSSAVAPKAA